MKLGLAMFPTHYAVHPAELGRIAEENGFESLFLPEHTHIPASRRSPYPGTGAPEPIDDHREGSTPRRPRHTCFRRVFGRWRQD